MHSRGIPGAGSLVLALISVCGPIMAAAVPNTAPNVVFKASGTFSKPPISGTDVFRLQGEPFSISVTASAGSVPIQSGSTYAVYSPLRLTGTVKSGLLQAPTTLNSYSTSVMLSYNATCEPFTMASPIKIVGLEITVKAQIMMPAGTMTTLFVHPFTAPVVLTPANATLTYSDGTDVTVLGINGTLTATEQAAASAAEPQVLPQLHSEGASAILAHADGTQSVRPLNAGPVELGDAQDTALLRFYASGVNGAADVQVQVAGQAVPVLYFGPSGHFAGLDEVTVKLPRSLAGSGASSAVLTVDGRAAQPVEIHIR